MTPQELEFTLPGLVRAAIATVMNPKDGAQMILRQRFPAPVLWLALMIVVLISVLMMFGIVFLTSGDAQLPNMFLASPFAMCVLQFAILTIMVMAVYKIGQAFGGKGRFEDALALVVWLQFVLACLQVVQTAAMLVAPILADMIGIFGLVLFLWLLTNFVAVQHGFKALTPVFLMILVSAFGLIFGITMVLSMLGFLTPGVPNV